MTPADIAYIENFVGEVQVLYDSDEESYIPLYIEDMIKNIEVILEMEKEYVKQNEAACRKAASASSK